MTGRSDRLALAAVVFTVLFSQVLLYPGVPQLVDSLGGSGGLDASTPFLAAEFAGFVLFAGVWGALSDRAGRAEDTDSHHCRLSGVRLENGVAVGKGSRRQR